MSRWTAASDYDYADEMRTHGPHEPRTIDRHCARCRDLFSVPADAIGQFLCPRCHRLAMHTQDRKARTA